jgi:uncharacterized protein (DUF2147 family)
MSPSTPNPSPLLLLPAAALLLALALPAAAQPADAVTGLWLTEAGDQGGRARVEVKQEGGEYVGRIVWLEEPEFPSGEHAGEPKIDLENPDPALRDRPILGLAILLGFTYDGDGTWSGGTIYDPANGKTYKAKMSLSSAADDTLDVRGYVGIPLFGRTSTWRRVEE